MKSSLEGLLLSSNMARLCAGKASKEGHSKDVKRIGFAATKTCRSRARRLVFEAPVTCEEELCLINSEWESYRGHKDSVGGF